MHFSKMYACRHDFILVDALSEPVEQIDVYAQYLCNRRTGIGADAVILLAPSDSAAAHVSTINADNSTNALCADSLRCAAKFLYDNGRVPQTSMLLDTDDGLKQVLVTPSQSDEAYSVTVDLGLARSVTPPIYNPYLGLQCIALGELYLVMEDDKLYGAPVDTLGQKLSGDPSLEKALDVCFVTVVNPQKLILRVWKHGIGEAHSDGTAAAAAAAQMMLEHKSESSVTVRMSGGDVTVTRDDDGHLLVTGPVGHVFNGTL